MKFIDYIKDKAFYVCLNISTFLCILALLILFHTNILLIMFIIIIYIIGIFSPLIIEYIKKKYFYNDFRKILNKLDKKYLITEIIKDSTFLDGKILLDYLYIINKNMNEEIKEYKSINNEFIEYIEMWCHEVKTPVATTKLIIDNNNNKTTLNILEEVEKIEYYIEQVLFYSKSDMVNKDYIIKETNLNDTANDVIKKNKKDLLNKKIKIHINDLGIVRSDSKWLEFIINQIVVNSIKYSKDKDCYIKMNFIENKNNKILIIEDNGIGIDSLDIDKVFDKGFTGLNGRKKYNSTGIGLYLCKKLCNKLGHNISIESVVNEFTRVSIIFPDNNYTDIVFDKNKK